MSRARVWETGGVPPCSQADRVSRTPGPAYRGPAAGARMVKTGARLVPERRVGIAASSSVSFITHEACRGATRRHRRLEFRIFHHA